MGRHEKECQNRIVTLAKLLKPCAVQGQYRLNRFGGPSDGGYVMIDDFTASSVAISIGVGLEASWDLELAIKGLNVKEYDHSVSKSPVIHERITFEPTRLVSVPDSRGKSLGEIAHEHQLERKQWILKIDVEGDEWDVFDAADEQFFTGCTQLVCEFHGFSRCRDTEFFSKAQRALSKLRRIFTPIHVHGNNFAGFSLVGNVPFPEVLEVSFASNTSYAFDALNSFFPTNLDRANNLDQPDLLLGVFQFG